MNGGGNAAPGRAEHTDSPGFVEYGDAHAHATRLNFEAFPYEAHLHIGGRAAAVMHKVKVGGRLALLVFAIPVIVCIVPLVAGIVGDIHDVQQGGSADDLVLEVVFVLLAVLVIVAEAMRSSKLSASDKGKRRRWKATPGGDATTISPDIALIDARSARCIGDAYPLVASGAEPDGSMLTAAWRIPGAGPLRAVPGQVIDTLALDAAFIKYANSEDMQRFRKWEFRVHAVYLECADMDGTTLRCWSNIVFGNFTPGQKVTAYLYRLAPDGGRPFLRVHDVADASQPVSVEDHQAVVFSAYMVSRGWKLEGEKPVGWLGGAVCDNSYSAVTITWPYGRTWRENVTAVGYRSDCMGDRAIAFGDGKGRMSVTRTNPTSDLLVGDENDMPRTQEAVEKIRYRGFRGTVEDVAVVPLFNRRFWCGYGYMALVRFSRYGKEESAWAFCDPGRDDSYLGTDEGSLRRPPVRVGDAVKLWRSGEGLCVVDPMA